MCRETLESGGSRVVLRTRFSRFGIALQGFRHGDSKGGWQDSTWTIACTSPAESIVLHAAGRGRLASLPSTIATRERRRLRSIFHFSLGIESTNHSREPCNIRVNFKVSICFAYFPFKTTILLSRRALLEQYDVVDPIVINDCTRRDEITNARTRRGTEETTVKGQRETPKNQTQHAISARLSIASSMSPMSIFRSRDAQVRDHDPFQLLS